MRASYIIIYPGGHKLRPVKEEDAEFIVKLRTQAHAQRFIGNTPADVEKQKEWIRRQIATENDYYWIEETYNGIPIGTTGLSNYDPVTKKIEPGRWVRIADAPEGISFMGEVVFKDFVYNELGMDRIEFDVVADNKQVIKYHKLMGEKILDGVDNQVTINGNTVHQVRFYQTHDMWIATRPRLCRLGGLSPELSYGKIERIMI